MDSFNHQGFSLFAQKTHFLLLYVKQHVFSYPGMTKTLPKALLSLSEEKTYMNKKVVFHVTRMQKDITHGVNRTQVPPLVPWRQQQERIHRTGN
jgi:hypothetical protein